MPTYDYICEKCGHTFEDIQMIANRDKPCDSPCPKCEALNIRRDFVGAPVYGQGIDFKAPTEFNDVMKKISQGHPDNTIKIRD